MRTAVLLAGVATCSAAVPLWPASWAMNQSTIAMACNHSGLQTPSATAGIGVLDFDWSNAKDLWAKAKPMNSEEMLLQQVQVTRAASPTTRTFVYRNAIKALPWFTSVRVLLEDPAYAPWFLPFGPKTVNGSGWHVPECDSNYDPPLCSALYHDQEQTPGYPTGDGDCAEPACDVGSVPVGEYLFDHRASNVTVKGQTFLDWFINGYILNADGGGSSLVDGFYFDDEWTLGGPSECDPHAVIDMGLSSAAVADLTAAYTANMAAAYDAVVAAGKFSWQQFITGPPGEYPLCGWPFVRQATCAADLRGLCTPSAAPQTSAAFAAYAPQGCTYAAPPPQFEADLANFLLFRGPYAWLGYSWIGCAEVNFTAGLPPALSLDYGEPLGLCAETAAGSGVFVREWSRATVQMDCNSWSPTITMKQ